jgi:hypothetical protein
MGGGLAWYQCCCFDTWVGNDCSRGGTPASRRKKGFVQSGYSLLCANVSLQNILHEEVVNQV